MQYIQKHPVNFVNIHEKNSIINFKKVLPNRAFSYILIHVVTLIAMKREVAAEIAGFPWSECQVKKLATSHCIHVEYVHQKCGKPRGSPEDTHGKVYSHRLSYS